MTVNANELIRAVMKGASVGPMIARQALAERDNDVARAIARAQELRPRPNSKPDELGHGRIEAGTHNNRIGALVEVRCGTDFVARTEEFRALCRELLLQALGGSGEGPLEGQDYVRDGSRKVGQLIDECARKVGETIRVMRYERWTM